MEVTYIEAIALLITSLVVPYVVALIRNEAISGRLAQWLAIGVSIIAGVVAGLAAGVPSSASAWITCLFASVGGVQVTYTVFRSIGITSKWLDALMEIRVGGADA